MGNCLPSVFGSHSSAESDSASQSAASYVNPLAFPHNSSYVNNLTTHSERDEASGQRRFLNAASEMTPSQEALQRVRSLLAQMPPVLFSKEMSTEEDVECAICMLELQVGERVRFLPCMHLFHSPCVDDWLLRNFSCPSCLEPVDSTMLSSLTAHNSLRLSDLAYSPASS